MKNFILVLVILILSCNRSQTVKVKSNAESIVVAAQPQDSLSSLPKCMRDLIDKMKIETVSNPPSKVYSYIFKNKIVYYIPGPCCDNFSDLYDDSCNLIAHPDGGFTGRGDGKLPLFNSEKSNEKLVWQDTRK
jgi:hypothetical protein